MSRTAARGKDVEALGAGVTEQHLDRDPVDELHVRMVPVLLGQGTRLVESLGLRRRLALRENSAAQGVASLRYDVLRP